MMDWSLDRHGRLELKGFFNELKGLKDPDVISAIRERLDAANEDRITAEALTDALVEIEPAFERYRKAIAALPGKHLKQLITVMLILLPVVWQMRSYYQAQEHHNENMDMLRAQQTLSEQQFEYQKERDRAEDLRADAERAEQDRLEERVKEIERDFEERLKKLEAESFNGSQSKGNQSAAVQKQPRIKGADRNKPCPCGSGIKAKKCHPERC
ncbi:MAG: SEC-C domain-containing protein [Alcanivorax jadensis]|uniref:SEC-C domain-containing protein n=1 Tax=Alcanivorax jadensis TaxID=64988 RepID=UPI00300328F2